MESLSFIVQIKFPLCSAFTLSDKIENKTMKLCLIHT